MVTENQQRYKSDTIFDNKLKKYRIEKNISITELAKLSGTTRSFITELELGKISPFDQKGNLKNPIYIISDILQCEISDIFDRDYCKIREESVFNNYVIQISEIDYIELIYEQEFDKKIMIEYVRKTLTDIYEEYDESQKKRLYYLIQHYILGMTMAEIANYHNVSRSLVGQRITKGLQLLKHPRITYLLQSWYDN